MSGLLEADTGVKMIPARLPALWTTKAERYYLSRLAIHRTSSKRTPSKVVAYYPLSKALSLLLQNPDVLEHVQDWRKGDKEDETGHVKLHL